MNAPKKSNNAAKEIRASQLRSQIKNSLTICQLEMQKSTPDLDRAYDFAARAQRAIGTLRVMTLGVAS